MMRRRSVAGLLVAAMIVAIGVGAAAQGPTSASFPASPEAPLADAERRQDKQVVLSLLAKKADVNARQPDGATALHWAAYADDAETTALLIRAGANVNVANDHGVSPFAIAARQGNANILGQLMKAGADPNDKLNEVNSGETPLMHAARSGSAEAVRLLIFAGARVNARESWNGQTALHWAAAEGQGAIVETLIEGGADVRQRSNAGSTPFMFAVREGDVRSVKAFLRAGADVNEKRPDLATPLLIAIINGHEDLVDLLLEQGADPNAEGGTTGTTLMGVRARPTRITLKTPSYSEQLRDVGTEGGNGSNNTWGRPLQAAVHLGNWTLSDDRLLVIFDRMSVIRSLIKHGADVNGRNTDMEPRSAGNRYRRRLVGLTAFLSAAKSADVEVMRLLVENGADPKMNTLLNITPLMLTAGIAWAAYQDTASEEQVLDAVKYLVEELGADVNFVADTGETALHAAAYRGANSVVQYLFDKGAKLDVVDKIGRTPLKVADGVEYGNSFAAQPHTAELLRKLGAKEIPCPGLCANIIPEEALPPEEPAK